MTGFARAEQALPGGKLSVEVKSVNHRYLEVFVRLPDSLRFAEALIRDQVRKRLSRGKLEVTVRWQRDAGEQQELVVQKAALEQLQQALQQVRQAVPDAVMPDALAVLQWPGVLAEADLAPEVLATAIDDTLAEAMNLLRAHRGREGQELVGQIEQRLEHIQAIVTQLRDAYPALQAALGERLRERIERLQADVEPQRLEQEIVMLLQKADIAEELDRLDIHISETRQVLKRKEPVGRRLDFLMQEFNREANTLGSKASSTDYTQAAIDLKVMIEQMREQIQNIE
ncbi:MAG: YicC family protein [Natronospirillum sp.]